MGTIEHEIDSQPLTWRMAAEAAAGLADLLPVPGGRLAVVGCGTSYFIGQSVAALWEAAGRGESDAFAASEMPSDRPYDLVLAISRSGTTTEVVDALARLRPDVPTIAICAVADTPVARAARHSVILGFADEEAIVQTRFATSVLAMIRAHLNSDIEELARNAEQALATPLRDDLSDFDQFVFLGAGWGVGIANEAALKVREAAGTWSESYPAMEYRHGPVSATRPTTLVWAVGPVEPSVLVSAGQAGATVVDSGRDAMAELVRKDTGATVEYQVGTMIELPRACLMAGEIAETAEFFSFGTNDLTQTTYGISRDDAASFLGTYTAKGIYPADPFVSLDREGVGELVQIAVERGRKVRPDIKLGICGEHGGDPASVAFCHEVGLDYVSCSPFRVPIARLAAAQAALGKAAASTA